MTIMKRALAVAAAAAAIGALAVPTVAFGTTGGTSPETAISLRLGHATHVNTAHYTGTTAPYQSCGAPPNSSAVWFSWVAPQSGTFVVDTAGSNFDTVLSVLNSSLGEIACNDDTTFAAGGCRKVSSDYCSQVTFTATQGETYYFLVGGYAGNGGGNLRIELLPG